PAVIVEQRIRNETDIREIREKFKQRIAGRGNQNFVSGFAQQTKNVTVGFACSRSEQDALRIDPRGRSEKSRLAGIIFGNRFARFQQTLAFGTIDKPAWIAKRR